MTQPTLSLVDTFTTKTKADTYTEPEILDIIEDLPTITNITAYNSGRLYLDDTGTIINTEPLPEADKEAPGYTKLPIRDEFAVSTLEPLQTFRYWVLIAFKDKRNIVQIDFPSNPLQGFDQTSEEFSIKNTPVGNAAQKALAEIKTNSTLPEAQPDAHDNWAYRLLIGLYQDSSSFAEENELEDTEAE